MSKISSLHQSINMISNQPECKTCRLCEEHVGLVYLLGDEKEKLQEFENKIITTSQGISYVQRNKEGCCSFFNYDTYTCQIYYNRPLCCRIYPLDLIRVNDGIWWVVHNKCPIAQRFQREHQIDILISFTIRLEKRLTENNIIKWLEQDNLSKEIEAFGRESTSITKIRLFKSNYMFMSKSIGEEQLPSLVL